MEKLKEGRVRRRQNIDFNSPLQLEACREQLLHSKPRSNLKIATQHTIHDDKLHFTARFYRGGKLSIRSRITMSRWEGTQTHLQGEVEFLRGGIRYKVLWVVWLLFSIMYCSWGQFASTSFDAAIGWKSNPKPNFAVICGLGLLIIYFNLFLLFAKLSDYLERRDLIDSLKKLLSENSHQKDHD